MARKKIGLRTSVAVAASLGSLALALACSSTSESQCKTDADCANILNLSADQVQCTSGICQKKPGIKVGPDAGDGGQEACTSTEFCKTKYPGEKRVCLKVGDPCVKFESAECQPSANWDSVIPDVQPLLLGNILALDAKLPDGTVGPFSYWIAESKAGELARTEWQRVTSGISVGAKQDHQGIVTFTCNSKNRSQDILAAVDFLNSLKVPAVMVGGQQDMKIALPRLVANNVFSFCSNCVGSSFTAAETKGLLYNLLPDDRTTLPPIAKSWLTTVETRIKNSGKPFNNGAKMRVAYFSGDYVGLVERATGIIGALEYNGLKATAQAANDFLQINVPSEGVVNWDVEVAKIVAQKPDVLFAAYGPEFFLQLLPKLEAAWPQGVNKPILALSGYEGNSDPLIDAITADPDLPKRMVFIQTVAPTTTTDNYDGFVTRYKAAFNSEPEGPNSYEMFYVLANTMVAALGDTKTVLGAMSGLDIARNIPFVVDSTSTRIIDTAPTAIASGVGFLANRSSFQPIQQRGIQSEFQFDTKTGLQKFDASVWCVVINGEDITVPDASYYHKDTGAIDAFDPTICKW